MELDFNKIIRLKKIRIEKSELSEEEKQILAKHWITYAPFDIAPIIWMYPES